MTRTPLAALFAALPSALALAVTAAVAAAPAPVDHPPERPLETSTEIAEIARSLPPLPRSSGGVVLPLSAEEGTATPAWSPIRQGVEIANDDQALAVEFTVVTGTPAGAALVVAPGTFSGVEQLRLRARANRNVLLVVSLQEAGGAAFALPAVPLRVGAAREHLLDLPDARYLEQQSTVPDPGRGCQLDQVVMVTLLDITGFLGPETPDVEWVVERLEGVAPRVAP